MQLVNCSWVVMWAFRVGLLAEHLEGLHHAADEGEHDGVRQVDYHRRRTRRQANEHARDQRIEQHNSEQELEELHVLFIAATIFTRPSINEFPSCSQYSCSSCNREGCREGGPHDHDRVDACRVGKCHGEPSGVALGNLHDVLPDPLPRVACGVLLWRGQDLVRPDGVGLVRLRGLPVRAHLLPLLCVLCLQARTRTHARRRQGRHCRDDPQCREGCRRGGQGNLEVGP